MIYLYHSSHFLGYAILRVAFFPPRKIELVQTIEMFSLNALDLTLIPVVLVLTMWGTVVSSQVRSYGMKGWCKHRAVMIISNIWGKVSGPFNPVLLSLACNWIHHLGALKITMLGSHLQSCRFNWPGVWLVYQHLNHLSR